MLGNGSRLVRGFRSLFGMRVVKATAAGLLTLMLATCGDPPTDPDGECLATVLAFVAPPASLTAGTAFSVRVEARDADGNVATCFTGNVTLALGTNPSGATLSGTLMMAASNGVANFTNLTLDRSGTGFTFSATAQGLTTGVTSPVAVAAGAAEHLTFTVQPTSTTGGAIIAPAVVVTAQDVANNTATGFTGNVTLSITTNSGTAGAALAGTVSGTAVAGVATFSDLSIDLAGSSYTLTAVSTGITSATSSTFNVTIGAVHHLAFTAQPTSTTGGATINPSGGVQVTAQDAGNNTVPSFTGSVGVAITSGTGAAGAVLSGTTPVSAVAGVATFSNLSIDLVGSNYTLRATSGTVTAATSSQFNVASGTADHLTFTTQPSNTSGGTTITPSVVVTAQDLGGNTSTGFTGNVTLTITSGTGTGGAALSGTTTVAAVAGVATFDNLSIDLSGNGYTLTAASAGVTSGVSSAFNITSGGVSGLAFTVQPTGTTSATAIAPAIVVTAQDLGGNTATGFTGNVTLAITSGSGSGGATLGGTTTVAAVAGVATFNDISVDLVGSGYTLTATSGAIPAQVSSAFNITAGPANSLAFTVQPTNTTAATAIAPAVVVTARDLGGNTATGFTGNVTVAIGAGPGGTLSGTTTVAAVAGVATFTNLQIDLAGTGYTLNATSTGIAGTGSSSFNIVTGAVNHLTFTAQPASTTGGAIINSPTGVTVTAQDAGNNTVTGFTGNVTVQLVPGPGATGTLSGTATVAAVAGVATFTNLSVDKVGNGYTLLATATGAPAVVSNAFNIALGPLSHLAFTTQPSNAISTAAMAPAVVVTAQDAGNNTVTGFTGNVALAITNGTGTAGAVLSGGAPVAAVGGVATFAALSVDKAGNGYTLTATATGAAAAVSSAFNIAIGAATQFVFTAQPLGATAGVNMPTVTVAAQDAGGNTVPSFGGNVTLGITGGTGTANANLSGGGPVAAVSGVATFTTLSIDSVGTGYTLTATGSLTSAVSNAFNINIGGLSQFAFTVQPTTTVAGAIINGAGGVQVTAQDAQGNALTSFVGQVTMSIGTNPVGGNMTGTLVKTAAAGVATFSDLRINTASPGYQLLASSGGAIGLSQAFTISPAAGNKLVFTSEPTNTTAGANINNPGGVVVTAQDVNNNTDPSFNGNVTIAITALTGTAGANLSGGATVTLAAVNGVATFPALNIDSAGINYSLTATATGLTGANSAAFNIVAGAASQLTFTAQPTNAVSLVSINNPGTGVVVTAQDGLGNTDLTFNNSVTMSISGGTGAPGALLSGGATVVVAAANGIATFNALNIDLAANGYTLNASINAGAVMQTSAAFNIAHAAPAQLIFTQQPTTATAGANIAPAVAVTVQDASGNIATTFTNPVTVAITGGTGTPNATLSGGASVQVTPNLGVATFTGPQALNIDSAGTNYTLTANINAGAITQGSAQFNIIAGPATQLAFFVQPATSTTAGVNIPGATGPNVVVLARDAIGNTDGSFAGPITLATTGAAAPLRGTNCAAGSCTASTGNGQLVNGVATFSGFNTRLAGTGYTLLATAGGVTNATSAAFAITADVVTQIAFITQPSNTKANKVITPAVQVAAQDSMGNTNTTWPNQIAVALSNDPGIGGSTLSGGTTATTGNGKLMNGVATFNDLQINKGGAGFVLQATSALPTAPVQSQAFSILGLYGINRDNNTITIHPAAASGDAAPTAVITGGNTGLNAPYAGAFDAAGNFYVTSASNNTIRVFASGATGDVAPIRVISGGATGLNSPNGIVVDNAGNVYVSNFLSNSITVYGPGANGNATPIRTIVGASTGLNTPFRVALDATGNLYVSNFNADTITVYAPAATGDAAPIRAIGGATTGLDDPVGLELDAIGNLYVVNASETNGTPSVTVFAPAADGDVAPTSTVTGASTGLNVPAGLAFFGGEIYVGNFGSSSITVYPAGANGNVAPTRVIQGAATLFVGLEDIKF